LPFVGGCRRGAMRYLLMFSYDETIDLGPDVGQLPEHRA
jgi:hypothetical protein